MELMRQMIPASELVVVDQGRSTRARSARGGWRSRSWRGRSGSDSPGRCGRTVLYSMPSPPPAPGPRAGWCRPPRPAARRPSSRHRRWTAWRLTTQPCWRSWAGRADNPPRMRPAEPAELFTQRPIPLRLDGLVTLGAAVLADQLARPPLGHPKPLLEMLDGAAPADPGSPGSPPQLLQRLDLQLLVGHESSPPAHQGGPTLLPGGPTTAGHLRSPGPCGGAFPWSARSGW